MYDRQPTRYSWGSTDFGAGADILHYLIGPKGKQGKLYDYGVFGLTEAFSGTTTTPQMAVGIVGDQDEYGNEFDFGALAIASGGKSLRTTYHMFETGYKTTYLVDKSIDADTVTMVTCIVATGTPTGQAVPFVDIIWDL